MFCSKSGGADQAAPGRCRSVNQGCQFVGACELQHVVGMCEDRDEVGARDLARQTLAASAPVRLVLSAHHDPHQPDDQHEQGSPDGLENAPHFSIEYHHAG
jgi:hypothetical protein